MTPVKGSFTAQKGLDLHVQNCCLEGRLRGWADNYHTLDQTNCLLHYRNILRCLVSQQENCNPSHHFHSYFCRSSQTPFTGFLPQNPETFQRPKHFLRSDGALLPTIRYNSNSGQSMWSDTIVSESTSFKNHEWWELPLRITAHPNYFIKSIRNWVRN